MPRKKIVEVSDGTRTYGTFSSEAKAKQLQKELKAQGVKTRLYIGFEGPAKEEPAKRPAGKTERSKPSAPEKKTERTPPKKKGPVPRTAKKLASSDVMDCVYRGMARGCRDTGSDRTLFGAEVTSSRKGFAVDISKGPDRSGHGLEVIPGAGGYSLNVLGPGGRVVSRRSGIPEDGIRGCIEDAAASVVVSIGRNVRASGRDIDVAGCSIRDLARFLHGIQQTCVDRHVWTDPDTGEPYPMHPADEIEAVLSNPMLAPGLCDVYLGCYISRFSPDWGGWDEETVGYSDWKAAEKRLRGIRESALKAMDGMSEEPEGRRRPAGRKGGMTVEQVETRISLSDDFDPLSGGLVELEGRRGCYRLCVTKGPGPTSWQGTLDSYEPYRSIYSESFTGKDAVRRALDGAIRAFLAEDDFVAVLTRDDIEGYRHGEWSIEEKARIAGTDYGRCSLGELAHALHNLEQTMIRRSCWLVRNPVYSEDEILFMLSEPSSAKKLCERFLNSRVSQDDILDVWYGGYSAVPYRKWREIAARLRRISSESGDGQKRTVREKPSFFRKRASRATVQSTFNKLDSVMKVVRIDRAPAFDREFVVADPEGVFMMEVRSTDGRSIFGFPDDGGRTGVCADLGRIRADPKGFRTNEGGFSEQRVLEVCGPATGVHRMPVLDYDARFVVDAESFKRELDRAQRFKGSGGPVVLYADGDDLMMSTEAVPGGDPADRRSGGMRADVGDVWMDRAPRSRAIYGGTYLSAVARLMQAADSDSVVEFSSGHPLRVSCRVGGFDVAAVVAPRIEW